MPIPKIGETISRESFDKLEKPTQTVQPQKKGFFSSVASDITKRGEQVAEIPTEKQTTAESALQLTGQAAGGLFDILGRGLGATAKGISAITPDIIEKPLKVGAKKLGVEILESSLGQLGLNAIKGGIEQYDKFKTANPRAARNLEAVVNIGALMPVGKAAQVTGKGAARVTGRQAGRAGRALEKGAEKTIQAKKQSFVRDLVRPEQVKKVKEAQVARTTEKGKGIFKKSIIEPTKQEIKAEQAVLKIPNISEKNTFQQNYNVIQGSNINLAKKLEKDILANDFIIPRKETISRLNKAKKALSESPTVVGDAEKTAQKLLSKMRSLVDENSGKASGILKARKKYDSWVRSQKPKAFSAETENAFSIANREIRQTLNDILEEKATNVAVKKSLAEQSSLFRAMDNVVPKAAKEADTAIKRLLDNAGELLGTKNRIVQSLAAAVGIGGLGAAATFAPAVAVLGGLGFFTYKGGKLIMNPQLRKGLGKVLQEIEKALPTATPKKTSELKNLKTQIKAMIDSEEGFGKLPKKPQLTKESRGQTFLTADEVSDIQREAARREKVLSKFPKGKGAIPKTIADDIVKAKAGGKSFDEFINKNKVFHGTKQKFKDFDFEMTGKSSEEGVLFGLKGAWFVDNKNIAKGYGKITKEANIDTSNFHKINARGKTLNNFRDEIWEAKKKVRDDNLDGLIIENLVDNADFSKGDVGTHIFALNKDTIKSKSQLKKLWDKK